MLHKKKLSTEKKSHIKTCCKVSPVALTLSLTTAKPHSFKDYLLSAKKFLEPKSTYTARSTLSELIGLDCIAGETALLHFIGGHFAPSCGQAEAFQFTVQFPSQLVNLV